MNPCHQEYQKMSINPRKKPHCSFCKNHGVMSSTKQHSCKYKLRCTCILCQLTKKAQVIMCHQQRVWRHNNQKHSDGTTIKGQKCDNCRNHLVFVKKSNHDCPFKNCECNYCKLTHKRREIMKHIQRARRLDITIDSNIQEREDDDDDYKGKASLNQLKSLCNDKEVDILMEATLSKEMESLSPPSSASPMQTEANVDSKATSSSFSPTSHPVYRGNEYPPIYGKGSKESCNLSLSSPDSTSRTRERRYSDPYQSRNKIRGYEENPMNRRFHISPFSFQDPQTKPIEDVKPIIFDAPARNPLNLSTEARNIVGTTDSRNALNSHCPRLPSNLQSSLAHINQIIPYPSPLDLGNYTTPHNPFLYPPYLEPNLNRVSGRQPIVRPEPINPSRSNRSTHPLSPFFLRPPTVNVQGTLSGQFWDNAYLPAPYPPSSLSMEIFKAHFRNAVIPYHVKVPSE